MRTGKSDKNKTGDTAHPILSRTVVFFLLLLLCFTVCASFACAFAGQPESDSARIHRFTLHSQVMGFNVPYLVWLPQSNSADMRYPVWYGLHGYSSSETMWLSTYHIGDVADRLLEENQICPLIMVFPLTRYDSAKVIMQDMLDGKRDVTQMERFLCEELIPYIDSHYATLPDASGRFIGGFSMGGMFALQIALHNPTMFGKVGAYSPALPYQDFSDANLGKWLFPWLPSPIDTKSAVFNARYPWQNMRLDMDCGGQSDPFSQGTQSLALALQERGVSVALHTHPGGHSLQPDRLPDYLRFYCGTH